MLSVVFTSAPNTQHPALRTFLAAASLPPFCSLMLRLLGALRLHMFPGPFTLTRPFTFVQLLFVLQLFMKLIFSL